MKIRNFTSKTRFSIEENSIMYRKSGCIFKKTQFLQGHVRLSRDIKSEHAQNE